MKTCDITKELIIRISEQKNRTKAIAEAGITKRQFYLSASLYQIDIRRSNSPYKLTDDDKKLIVQLVKEYNLTLRQAAEKFDVSHTTVRRHLNHYA